MLRFLARFLAVVLAIVFVMAAAVAVFLRPIGTEMLSPQTYKDVIREERVAERMPELVADTLVKSVAAIEENRGEAAPRRTGDMLGFLSGFAKEDLQTLLGAVLPADYVHVQLESSIDQVFGYVNSEAARPVVKIDVADLKKRLAGGVLEDAYVQILQSKPPCEGEPVLLPVGCCPPADQLPEVRRVFREKVVPSVEQLPDAVDLFAQQPSSQSEQVYRMMAQVRGKIRTFAAISRWGWVLPVLLLVGVAVFAVRSVRGLLLWWGVPCLIAGAFTVLFALPGAAMGTWFFELMVEPFLPEGTPVMAVEAALGMVATVAQVVLGAALKSALWLVLGGGVAVALGFFLKTEPKAA